MFKLKEKRVINTKFEQKDVDKKLVVWDSFLFLL